MQRAGLALFAVLLSPVAPAHAAPRYETPPIVLSARELAPPVPLSGERYRVLDRVENDGFMNRWLIESDWGEIEAEGDAMLRVRLREIDALIRLEEVARSEAFLDAMERSLTGKWKAARQVIESPVATAKKVPAGVARLFRRKKRQARDLSEEAREEYRELKDDVAERKAGRDGESGDEGAEAGAEAPSPEEEKAARRERRREVLHEAKEVAKDVGEEARRFFQKKSGYRRARRHWARALGVDPYGDNDALNQELFRVAVASAAGGLSLKILVPLPTIPGLGELADVKELVYDLDSLDLRLRNEKILFDLGFERAQLDALYDSRAWSDTLITDLTEALSALATVGGLDLLMSWALEAEERENARFQAAIAEHFAELHGGRTPLVRLHDGESLVSAVTSVGTVVAALAVDRLAWTPLWAGLWKDELPGLRAAGDGRVELHLRGDCSDLARRRIRGRTVRVVERAF